LHSDFCPKIHRRKADRARFTLQQASADSATYKFEMATGDEPLKLIMEGKQTHRK